MKKYRLLLALIMAVTLLVSCGKPLISTEIKQKKSSTGESWTVMVYMCAGADEYEYGTAANALKELTRVKYTENLKVIAETGGTYKWNEPGIDTNYLDRFEAQNGSLRLIERTGLHSMAQASTLTDFIKWGKENYESDNYALILYGSGANSAYGALHDQIAANESMNLQRVASAINQADLHFDIIGFDADLMASVENAALLADCADYMVASQEVMASDSWNYADWLQYIIDNPSATALDVSISACDTYVKKCGREGNADMATMSVTQLSEITSLSQSLDGMAGEMTGFLDSLEDYSELAISLDGIMRFGSAAPNEGYSNMVDLNDFAVRSSAQTTKTSGTLQERLSSSVMYCTNGRFRHEASGLSVFYPLNQSPDELSRYMELSPLKRYREFLAQICANAPTGSEKSPSDTEAYEDFLAEQNKLSYLTVAGNTGLELNMMGNMDIVRSVNQRVFMHDENALLYIGNAYGLDENKEAGIFKTQNNYHFPTINGHPISLSTVYRGDGYTLYSSPIMIDGVLKNLRIAEYWDNGKQKYKSLDMHDSLGPANKSSRHITKIHIYNQLTPMFSGYAQDSLTAGSSFKTWPFGMSIKQEPLKDGSYLTDFRITYIYGSYFTSGNAEFDYSKNNISYK